METPETPEVKPLKPFTELGLSENFDAIVKVRQELGAGIKKLTADQTALTNRIKQEFIRAILQCDSDPKQEEDFRDLCAAIADTGEAACSAAGYDVRVNPSERKTIDEKELRLVLVNKAFPLDVIDEIVKAVTKTTRGGTIEIEPSRTAAPAASTSAAAPTPAAPAPAVKQPRKKRQPSIPPSMPPAKDVSLPKPAPAVIVPPVTAFAKAVTGKGPHRVKFPVPKSGSIVPPKGAKKPGRTAAKPVPKKKSLRGKRR